MKEIWKDIFDYYEVSSVGNVRSKRFGKTKALKSYTTRKGYKRIGLWVDGSQKKFLVHRLMLIAFKGVDKNKGLCNHIDGVKNNNVIENLEWVTDSENTQHGYDIGLIKRPSGNDHIASILSNNEVRAIRKIDLKLITKKRAAKIYGVSESLFGRAFNYKTYKNV